MLFRLLCLALLLPGTSVAELTPGSDAAQIHHCAESALDAKLAARRDGGWAMKWTQDQSVIWGEHSVVPEDWITVQPPATPGVALVMLRAAQVLDEERYLLAAIAARNALLALQSPEGGLPHEGKPGVVRKSASFDDHATTGALEFFIALWLHTGDEKDRAAVDSVGEFILAAQYPGSGGWPQNYPPRPGSYHEHITFNDGVMRNVILALLRLHVLTGEDRYRDAARRGGECILKLQGGPGESVWAQQYDKDTLKPAQARNFEPAGYTAGESVGACDTLIDLYLEFEDPRYLDAIELAIAWYDTHRLPNGKYARIYEPGTQRPVYGLAKAPFVTYDVSEARPGYGWQANWYPTQAKAALEQIRRDGVEAYRATRNLSKRRSAADLISRARELCSKLSADGHWLNNPTTTEAKELVNRDHDPDQKIVSTRTFVNNMNILLDYLEAQHWEAGLHSGDEDAP